jgi:hypothetical protein
MLSKWIVGLLDLPCGSWIVRPALRQLDFWIVGLLDFWIVGLLDCLAAVGLLDCLTAVRLFDC